MAAWVCRGCTAVYSVGAPACPQCGSADWREQGAPADVEPAAGDEETTDGEEEDDGAEDHSSRRAD